MLLLFPSERHIAAAKEAISAFLQHLWDAGLRMSHSVRTPDECAEVHDSNTELNISLLDQRYLTGDRTLYAGLADRLPRFIHANRDALVRNLAQLTRDRHTKYAGTFYHLEPNVKDTPGGLRDYQLVCWLGQLREGAADPSAELREAYHFLARLRCYLHIQSGRDNNLLTFDAQDALAEHWRLPDAAQWMREYYRHARAIYRAAIRALEAGEGQTSSLFAQFRDFRSRVSNAEFSVHRERVHFRAPQRLDVEPELALRLFEFVARHGVRLSSEAEQRIAARLPLLRDYFIPPQHLWPALSQLLALPHAPAAVRAMHETGVLTAIFPELAEIECLVIRDFFHRYTVDEHTLVTLQNLWSLRTTADPWCRSFRDLLAEIKEPGVLAFALLFHDSGKGTPTEGHMDASLRLVQDPMARIQMPWQDRDMVTFLIERHLDLSAAMFFARRLRPADHPRRGPPDGHGGAPQSAHPAHLRRYQRGQSHGHDPLARRATLAALPQGLQRTHPRACRPSASKPSPRVRPSASPSCKASPCATCAPTPKPGSASTWRSKRRAASAAWRWTSASWIRRGN